MTFLHICFLKEKLHKHIHSHCDLNSVSSSTDNSPPAIPHWIRLWKPHFMFSCDQSHDWGPAPLFRRHLSLLILVTVRDLFGKPALLLRESLHCFHTFIAVSLLDPVAKLPKAGEQRGTALREEKGCVLRLPTAALRITDWEFQTDSEPSLLGTATFATGVLQQSTHNRQCLNSTHLSIYLRAHLPVLRIIQKTKLSRGLPLSESRTKILPICRVHFLVYVKLAQLVKARDCQSQGCWFDSGRNSKDQELKSTWPTVWAT